MSEYVIDTPKRKGLLSLSWAWVSGSRPYGHPPAGRFFSYELWPATAGTD